jgi:hypothetical protein
MVSLARLKKPNYPAASNENSVFSSGIDGSRNGNTQIRIIVGCVFIAMN